MKIANRTFVVSGGSSGLGLSTVQDLVKGDAYIAILDISPPPASWLGTEDASGNSHSRRVLYIKADITKVDEIERAVERAAEWTKETGAPFGGVLNCAGMGKPKLLVDRNGTPHSLGLWDYTLALNLTGTFNLTRLVLRHLVQVNPDGEDGERGVIIMVSSEAAFDGQAGVTAYAASKGALLSMTLPMARDCSRHGIRVVTIAPGPFTTPLTDLFPQKVHDGLAKAGLLFPKRYGMPREFSATVRWVLECGYVNGETIRLNGGGRVPTRL